MALPARIVVIGGGPSGMTAALLLARAGHRVRLVEAAHQLGGLWATDIDGEGHYRGENSCKVYQPDYHSAPALFRLIGTRWQDHFTGRHALSTGWLHPFLRDCSPQDLARLARDFALFFGGIRDFRKVSVRDYLHTNSMSEACRSWLRATALGGVTGTLDMTVWELFHRFRGNLASVFLADDGALYWNAQPPNSPQGFLPVWERALREAGVDVALGERVTRLDAGPRVSTSTAEISADAVFLAMPPPAMASVLARSPDAISLAFGHKPETLQRVLRESVYEHLGLLWLFDQPLPADLPLGGHNVLRGWHPILVQHSQYAPWLKAPAMTAVVGSISLETQFRHPRLGTLAREHPPDELARIVWQDEREANPMLPEPIEALSLGVSSATQIIRHGPLPVKAAGQSIYLATNLNGQSPYFTSSLEAAIQAGAAAAAAFDPAVERLPTGAPASRVARAKAALSRGARRGLAPSFRSA